MDKNYVQTHLEHIACDLERCRISSLDFTPKVTVLLDYASVLTGQHSTVDRRHVRSRSWNSGSERSVWLSGARSIGREYFGRRWNYHGRVDFGVRSGGDHLV